MNVERGRRKDLEIAIGAGVWMEDEEMTNSRRNEEDVKRVEDENIPNKSEKGELYIFLLLLCPLVLRLYGGHGRDKLSPFPFVVLHDMTNTLTH